MCEEKKSGVIETEHGTYTTQLTKKYLNRKPWQPENPKELRSGIPGTVCSIAVKEGDTVKEGDELLIFTAMKMNNVLRSPADGTIKSIPIAVGDRIPKGTLMIEFE